MNHHTTVLFLQVLSIILILSTDSLPKPVASIGAGGGGQFRVLHYQLTLANLQAHGLLVGWNQLA